MIVRSSGHNEGRIVRCLRLAGEADFKRFHPWRFDLVGPVWVVDGKVQWARRDGTPTIFADLAPDNSLRPIRDNDGEDETLTWAGKPADIKTPEAA